MFEHDPVRQRRVGGRQRIRRPVREDGRRRDVQRCRSPCHEHVRRQGPRGRLRRRRPAPCASTSWNRSSSRCGRPTTAATNCAAWTPCASSTCGPRADVDRPAWPGSAPPWTAVMGRWLTDLADVCRPTGWPVVEVDGWQTAPGESRRLHRRLPDRQPQPRHGPSHRRPPSADGWPDVNYCTFDDDDAPLCNLYLSRDGTIYVCAAGGHEHQRLRPDPCGHLDRRHDELAARSGSRPATTAPANRGPTSSTTPTRRCRPCSATPTASPPARSTPTPNGPRPARSTRPARPATPPAAQTWDMDDVPRRPAPATPPEPPNPRTRGGRRERPRSTLVTGETDGTLCGRRRHRSPPKSR